MSKVRLRLDATGTAMQFMPKKRSKTVAFDNATTTNRTAALVGNVVQVMTTANCWVKRGGSNVTATTTPGADNVPLLANMIEHIDITPEANYLAVIGMTGAGTFYVIEGE